jgi:hypothetical protein
MLAYTFLFTQPREGNALCCYQHGWTLTVFLVAVVRSSNQQMPMRLDSTIIPEQMFLFKKIPARG